MTAAPTAAGAAIVPKGIIIAVVIVCGGGDNIYIFIVMIIITLIKIGIFSIILTARVLLFPVHRRVHLLYLMCCWKTAVSRQVLFSLRGLYT